MKGELSFQELEKSLEQLAKGYPEMRDLPEWKALRDEMRKAKRRGAKCLTLDVFDAMELLEEAVIYTLAVMAVSPRPRPPALLSC